MKAKSHISDAFWKAFAMKGQRSIWLIAASTLIVAAFGNALANVLGQMSQCILYGWHATIAEDPGRTFRNSLEQVLVPSLLLLGLIVFLIQNSRRNSRTPDIGVPDPHKGLVVMLSRYTDRNGECRFPTMESALQAVASEGIAPVRNALIGTSVGPLIAAVEHHRPALRRCWVVVTEGADGSRPLFEPLTCLLKKIVPQVEFVAVSVPTPYDIREMSQVIDKVFRDAAGHPNVKGNLIADFTGGTAAMSAGMILATLSEDRDLEYMRQDIPLSAGGVALSVEEIQAKKILMAVITSPAFAIPFVGTAN